MNQPTGPTRTGIRQWLLREASEYLDIPVAEIDPAVPLTDYGLTSVTAVALCTAIEEDCGVEIGLETFWTAGSVDAISAAADAVGA